MKQNKHFVKCLGKHKIKVIFDSSEPIGEKSLEFIEKGINSANYALMCYTSQY